MQRREITVETTVVFTSHSIWPDDYGDMTLTEAMAHEAGLELDDYIEYSDHSYIDDVNVRSVEVSE